MSLQHIIYRVSHGFPGGVVGLSDLMGKNDRVMNQKINPNNNTHFLTLEEVETIADFTNSNLAMAEYFAGKANCIIHALPDVSHMDEEALLDAFVKITKQMGDLSAEFLKSYRDGMITIKEFKSLAIEIGRVESALMVYKATLERMIHNA